MSKPKYKLGKMNEGQVKFAEVLAHDLADGVSDNKAKSHALTVAYPNVTSDDLRSRQEMAGKLANHPKIKAMVEEIMRACRVQFVLMSPEAIVRLEELAKSADSEKVRLEANKEILDRGGLKPPEQVQIEHVGIFGEASLEDIRDMVRRRIDDTLVQENFNQIRGSV